MDAKNGIVREQLPTRPIQQDGFVTSELQLLEEEKALKAELDSYKFNRAGIPDTLIIRHDQVLKQLGKLRAVQAPSVRPPQPEVWDKNKPNPLNNTGQTTLPREWFTGK